MKPKTILPLFAIIAICGLLVFSPGIVCIGLMHVCSFFDDHAKIACKIAGVAPIPVNAEKLKSGGWSTGFSNQSSCVFKFDNDEQLNEWIKNSPSIRDQQPVMFTPSHPLISFNSFKDEIKWRMSHQNYTLYPPFSFVEKSIMFEDVNDFCFSLVTTNPKWFTPYISHGRAFTGKYASKIYIDDVNNVVWITASSD